MVLELQTSDKLKLFFFVVLADGKLCHLGDPESSNYSTARIAKLLGS